MKHWLIGFCSTLLFGCASMGDQEYGCSGLPEGVRCLSTHDMYEASSGGQVVQASAPDGKPKSPAGNAKQQQDQDKAGEPLTDPVIDTFVTPNLPDRPVPVRTPSRVMRIWVASWEDTGSGALMAPGYIYTEIEPRRWVIGKPESAARQLDRLFTPLEQTRVIPNPSNIPQPEKE